MCGHRRVLFPNSKGGLPPKEITIAEALREKGCAAGHIGKWHLGIHEGGRPLDQGFQRSFGLPYSNDMDARPNLPRGSSASPEFHGKIQYDVMDGAVRHTQLFNLADNPHEFLKEHHDPQVIALTGVTPAAHQVNLADDPRHAQKLSDLQALLLAAMRRLDDPWQLWNQPDDGLTPPPSPSAGKGKASPRTDKP